MTRTGIQYTLAVGLLLGACAPSSRTSTSTPVPAGPASALPRATEPYDSLLARVKRGDLAVDWLAFRLAYAESPGYAPYAFDTEARERIGAAIKSGDHQRALAIADSLLEKNFVDIQAHLVAAGSHAALGDSARAGFHATIARGLVASIRDYASGTTPDSAILVISIDEEYALLGLEGYTRERQAMMTCAGHPCDLLTALGRDGKRRNFYFNVAIPFGSFTRSMGKDTTSQKP